MKTMKMALVAVAVFIATLPLAAQQTAEEFAQKYDRLAANVGVAGVGVETLLNRWETAFPEDTRMMEAKFLYHFAKSQSSEVVKKEQPKYLGKSPVVSLKDSLGNDVNYFDVTVYDDETFGLANSYIDKAIQLEPDRYDLRDAKITALIAYEQDSPDMATSQLRALIDYDVSQHPKWTYMDRPLAEGEFDANVQEFCFLFFRLAEPACFEAFREISERMLNYYPKNYLFLDNMGSYYLVVKSDKSSAVKYYSKSLKVKKDDVTAIKNLMLIARSDKDVKSEKKYLEMLVQYTEDEGERVQAQGRLKMLERM